jgi:phosphoesterase RecJ-like protein
MSHVPEPSAETAPRGPIDWNRFAELIGQNRRFLLTTHTRPDSDALGSSLAMDAVLRHLGKEVWIVNGHEVPPGLRFLDPEQRLLQLDSDVTLQRIEPIDVVMILDTSAWAQLGHVKDLIERSGALRIVVDHHVSGDDLQAETFKDPGAEATGRLVAEAADALGVPIGPQMATQLFAALATDTGWFRFSSTTPGTYRLAARLVEAGASPERIYRELYERDTIARLQLIGQAVANARSELDGRLVYSWLTRADFDRVGALPADSEDIINMLLSVGGTEVAIMLTEQTGGGFKVSLRSRSEVDCSRLAERFGGGGHRKASGATLPGPLEESLGRLLDAVRTAMR